MGPRWPFPRLVAGWRWARLAHTKSTTTPDWGGCIQRAARSHSCLPRSAMARAPDGRWLAVGAVGPHKVDDNAQLRLLDTTSGQWHDLASMFVNGPTLAWSADGSLLAAASVSQQGEVIWHWPAASLDSIIPNRESANIEQLGWAQDVSALVFTLGARSGGAPFPDEVYAQSFPVPPGVSSFAFPAWFLDVL